MRAFLSSGAAVIFAFACLSLLVYAGCSDQPASITTSPAASSDQAGRALAGVSDFDAGRAFEHVKQMVGFGPHPSGSEAIRKTQKYIEGELKSYGLKVTEDSFSGETPKGPIPMMNITAELPGSRPEIVMITGHYDTKLMNGFVGANDGGSSAAAVLEIARVLSKTRPEYTLWFVFFDGEEAVVDWGAMNGMDNTYGSRHMASKLKSDGSIKRVKAMVLLDMIGDRNLDLRRDDDSTRWMVDAIWNTARDVGYSRYFLGNETAMADDHIPFRQAGVPVVDIIDFNYGPDNSYWHTTEDSLDKISGDSMKIVGDVVIRSLPEIYRQIQDRDRS